MRSENKISTRNNIKNNCPEGPRAHRPMKMNRILIFNLYHEKNKKNTPNRPMSKNLNSDEKHLNPEPLANRPMPETRKTKSSLILWNKIVSFKNQLRSN